MSERIEPTKMYFQALREAALEFEAITIKIGINDGIEESLVLEKFRSINPKLRVPVLAIDENIITEAPAILTAVSKLVPHLNLLGSNDMETIRAYEWMNWLSGTLHGQGFGALWRPQRYTSDKDLYSNLQKHADVNIRDCYAEIEGRLSGVHSVGNAFTVVDAYLLVFWRWGKNIGIDMGSEYPKYSALASAVLGRDSTKAAMEAEGIASKI
jgi:glutathione S-transferase